MRHQVLVVVVVESIVLLHVFQRRAPVYVCPWLDGCIHQDGTRHYDGGRGCRDPYDSTDETGKNVYFLFSISNSYYLLYGTPL